MLYLNCFCPLKFVLLAIDMAILNLALSQQWGRYQFSEVVEITIVFVPGIHNCGPWPVLCSLLAQVMARHRSASPDCPFVKDESDNVPVLQGGQEVG